MAAGDLSADQRKFVELVADATGLDETVVVAWVGQESGWSKTKTGDHNYLNIGPGRTYSSVTTAAAATASLINTSGYYGEIRKAAAAGDPAAQVQAIVTSPWDAGRYGGDGSHLWATYQSLGGKAPTGGSSSGGSSSGDSPSNAEKVGSVVLDAIPGGSGLKALLGIGAGGTSWTTDLLVGGLKVLLLLSLAIVALWVIAKGLLELTDADDQLKQLIPGLVAARTGA